MRAGKAEKKKKEKSKTEKFLDALKDVKISESVAKKPKTEKPKEKPIVNPFKDNPDEVLAAESLVALWFYKGEFPEKLPIKNWIHGPGVSVYRATYQPFGYQNLQDSEFLRNIKSYEDWWVLSAKPWPKSFTKSDNVVLIVRVSRAPVWGIYMPLKSGSTQLEKVLKRLYPFDKPIKLDEGKKINDTISNPYEID